MTSIALLSSLLLCAAPLAGQTRYASGQDAFAEGDFDTALAHLEAAANQATDEGLLVKIHLLRGQCLLALADETRAEEAFTQALEYDSEVKLDPAKVRPTVVAQFERLRGRLKAELKIRADRAGPAVLMDGQKIGSLPLVAQVPIGRHTFEVKDDDGTVYDKREIVIRARQSHELTLRLGSGTRPADPDDDGADHDPAPQGGDDGHSSAGGGQPPPDAAPDVDEFVPDEESSVHLLADVRGAFDVSAKSAGAEVGLGVSGPNLGFSAHGIVGKTFGADLRVTTKLPKAVASLLGFHLSLEAAALFPKGAGTVLGAGASAGLDLTLADIVEPFLEGSYRRYLGGSAGAPQGNAFLVGGGVRVLFK